MCCCLSGGIGERSMKYKCYFSPWAVKFIVVPQNDDTSVCKHSKGSLLCWGTNSTYCNYSSFYAIQASLLSIIKHPSLSLTVSSHTAFFSLWKYFVPLYKLAYKLLESTFAMTTYIQGDNWKSQRGSEWTVIGQRCLQFLSISSG